MSKEKRTDTVINAPVRNIAPDGRDITAQHSTLPLQNMLAQAFKG